MSVTVTRTKIRVPRRRDDLLSRARLNAVLDDVLDYPFTLISAPAGYGKTSLMIDMAHQAPFPTCWYSIDALDRDPARFLTYLINSVRLLFPDCGAGFLSLLEELPRNLINPDQLAATLVNDLYSAIQEHFVIFLDDYHLLDNNPFINSFISRLGQDMDDNVHLVLASRTLFSFPDLALLIGRKLVKGIDQRDLAFRADEIQAYLESKLDQPVTAEESQALEFSTEGWITGLLLFAYRGPGQLPDQAKAFKVTGANIADYFQSQVFDKQTPLMRELLVKAALVAEFNADICQQIFGEPEGITWPEFISQLLEHNLFVELVEDEGTWIHFHHLFRDFLLGQLERDETEHRKTLFTELLNWQISLRDWENAFETARKMGDPQTMAEIIQQASSPLFHAGRIQLLADWLEILPEKLISKSPNLIALKGFTAIELGDPLKGISILEKFIDNFNNRNQKNQLIHANIWLSTGKRFVGQYNEALCNGLHGYELSLEFPNNSLEKAEAAREIGLVYSRLGDNQKAIAYLEQSINLYIDNNKETNVAQVQMDIGYILLNTGKLNESRMHFENALKIWSLHNNYSQLALTFNNLGYLSLVLGNYVKAKDFIGQSLEYASKVSNLRIQAFSIGSFGDLAIAIQLFKRGIEYFKKACNIADNIHDNFLSIYFNICLGTCYRYINDLRQSNLYLSKISKNAISNKYSTESGLWHLEKGFNLLQARSNNDALNHLEEAKEIFLESNKPIELAKAQLGLLLYSFETGENNKVHNFVEEFLSSLQQVESYFPLLQEICHHKEKIKKVIGIFPGYPQLSKLLEKTNRYLTHLPELQTRIFPNIDPAADPDHLSIQAFGSIQVHKGGQRISASEWIHQKTAREILYYLLSQSQGVTKEQLGLAFWPDSSPRLLSCQFKNAIYRLRRALGKEIILYNQDTRTYSFNRKAAYSYDVELFSEICQQAESETHPERRIEILRQAVSLYRHPFAPELGGVWAEPLRRQLYLQYERAQLLIAEYELEEGHFQACQDICLSILTLEPCQEKAYQLCMRAYSEQKDKTSLRRIFENCKDNFYNILGTSPSNELETLFHELI